MADVRGVSGVASTGLAATGGGAALIDYSALAGAVLAATFGIATVNLTIPMAGQGLASTTGRFDFTAGLTPYIPGPTVGRVLVAAGATQSQGLVFGSTSAQRIPA
jgi:hypothetical protein